MHAILTLFVFDILRLFIYLCLIIVECNNKNVSEDNKYIKTGNNYNRTTKGSIKQREWIEAAFLGNCTDIFLVKQEIS